MTDDECLWLNVILHGTCHQELYRFFKFGYSSHLISFSDLIKSCSEDLFENAHKYNHCLHELFSSYVHRLESLRPRGHDLMLPACTGYLHKQSFIIRSLFDFFCSFTLLLFRFLFRSLEFVRLSHSLINTVLLYSVSVTVCSLWGVSFDYAVCVLHHHFSIWL